MGEMRSTVDPASRRIEHEGALTQHSARITTISLNQEAQRTSNPLSASCRPSELHVPYTLGKYSSRLLSSR